MKTTLDLPDALVKQMKLRALHEGKKFKDAVADTLRAGLAATPALDRAYAVNPMTNDDVLRIYEGLASHAAVAYREEPHDIASLWPRLARRTTASPNVWMDAYLAAFAITARLMLVTLDQD